MKDGARTGYTSCRYAEIKRFFRMAWLSREGFVDTSLLSGRGVPSVRVGIASGVTVLGKNFRRREKDTCRQGLRGARGPGNMEP